MFKEILILQEIKKYNEMSFDNNNNNNYNNNNTNNNNSNKQ